MHWLWLDSKHAAAAHCCLHLLATKLLELLAEVWEAPLDTQGLPNMADMLHLAVNMQQPAAAVAMLQFVQQLRQQLANMQQLQRQLQELQQAAEASPNRRSRAYKQKKAHEKRAEQLQLRLQEFDRQVNAAEVEQLLTTAIARMHSAVVEQLCALPAAKQLPGSAIKQLMERCIVHQSPEDTVLPRLLRLLGTADARAALAPMFGTPSPSSTAANPASRLRCCSSSSIQPSVQYHLYHANPLPWCNLMKAAVTHGNEAALIQLVESINSMPPAAAQVLDSSALEDLLATAVKMPDSYAVSAVQRTARHATLASLACSACVAAFSSAAQLDCGRGVAKPARCCKDTDTQCAGHSESSCTAEPS
jgi:hypothetical protein